MTTVQYTQIAIAIGSGIALVAFTVLIAWPAWNSYGRAWERFSALFLSFYILAAMLAVGVGVGLAVFAVVGQRV